MMEYFCQQQFLQTREIKKCLVTHIFCKWINQLSLALRPNLEIQGDGDLSNLFLGPQP